MGYDSTSIIRLRIFQKFPSIRIRNQKIEKKIWKFVLPSSVEVLLYYLRTISSCFSAFTA